MNAMEQKNKMVIYQVFPRWFGNLRPSPVMNGSLAENGVGKFSAFTPLALSKIKATGSGGIANITNHVYILKIECLI